MSCGSGVGFCADDVFERVVFDLEPERPIGFRLGAMGYGLEESLSCGLEKQGVSWVAIRGEGAQTSLGLRQFGSITFGACNAALCGVMMHD
jgi:hypothetical protein